MNILRKIGIKIINFFPARIKWILVNLQFLNRRLRIDYKSTRRILLSNNSKIFVIGANDGLSFDNLFDDLDPNLSSGLLIEPSSRYFEKLVKNSSKFPHIKTHKFAVNTSNTSLVLYQLNESGLKKMPDWGRGLGSFSKSHLLKHDILSDLDIECELVVGKTFISIIQEFDLFTVHYLQIDTEGFDAEIIKMIDFSIFRALLIQFEVSNLSSQELSDVSNKLKKECYFLVRSKGDMIAYSKYINPHFY